MIIDVYTHMISKRVGAILNKGTILRGWQGVPLPCPK